jgi:glycosyltransferase involved in cell wall biosynthesis
VAGKPKLLVLATTFPKSLGDGTPSFVLDIAQEHSKHFQVWVLTPMVPGAKRWETVGDVKISRFYYLWPATEDLADGSIMDNLKKGFYQKLQLPFMIASFSYRFLFRVLIWRPAAIHAHWIIPGGFVAKLAPWVPRVITTHGGDVYALNSKPLFALKKSIIRNSAVTTVNTEMKDQLIAKGLVTHAEVIPMGVKITNLNAKKKPSQIVFVGRLVEKKGLEYLLHAIDGLDCKLKVIGDGPLRESLENKAPANAEFLGQQSKDTVMQTIAESELMVIPSVVAKSGDREGLPVTLMEAAANKTAVIATDMSGINDVITDGESGLLVPEKDIQGLKDAIQKVLGDKKLRAKLAENLHLKAKDFDIEVVSQKYLEVIQGVIK